MYKPSPEQLDLYGVQVGDFLLVQSPSEYGWGLSRYKQIKRPAHLILEVRRLTPAQIVCEPMPVCGKKSEPIRVSMSTGRLIGREEFTFSRVFRPENKDQVVDLNSQWVACRTQTSEVTKLCRITEQFQKSGLPPEVVSAMVKAFEDAGGTI